MFFVSIPRQTRAVAFFTCAYLLIALGFTLFLRNWEFLFYLAALLVITLAVLFIHKKTHFTKGLLWCLSLWALLHLLGGLMPLPVSWPVDTDRHVLYNLWIFPFLKFDQLLHAYGFAVATWACYQALRSFLPATTPRLGLLMICVFAGMGLGALNEILEFLVTLVLKDNNVGGYENTGWDLVSNFLGSVLAALFIHYGVPLKVRRRE